MPGLTDGEDILVCPLWQDRRRDVETVKDKCQSCQKAISISAVNLPALHVKKMNAYCRTCGATSILLAALKGEHSTILSDKHLRAQVDEPGKA